MNRFSQIKRVSFLQNVSTCLVEYGCLFAQLFSPKNTRFHLVHMVQYMVIVISILTDSWPRQKHIYQMAKLYNN